MAILFAYHRTFKKEAFKGAYYHTNKLNPTYNDTVYVISSDKPKAPNYYLEGKYRVVDIETSKEKKRNLILQPILICNKLKTLNNEKWFENKEFHNIFTSGQSFNPVPNIYIERFERHLKKYSVSMPDVDNLATGSHDAIDDSDGGPADRAKITTYRYKRNPLVRDAVRMRSKGFCEYCDEGGFVTSSGEMYIECHHVISLADQGEDRVTNVIALCPKHHREAHFGKNAEMLEREMIIKLQLINGGAK
jgi:hypothetical protein